MKIVQWEYKAVPQRHAHNGKWMTKGEALDMLNFEGILGWELVCTDYCNFILKRPRP